jgi:hypothetical protein
LDFTTLLPDAAIIADEVDAQLKQQRQRFYGRLADNFNPGIRQARSFGVASF